MSGTPVRLAVIQPTSLCNLNCRYCYVPDRMNAQLMTPAVLRATIEFVLAALPDGQREVVFLWHAGEPLTAGLHFYRSAFALVAERAEQRGVKARHSFQTNATLVTDEWAELFGSVDTSIGVSIDGPRHLHDANRVGWNDRGSFDRVMRGVRTLRRHDFDPAAICVLTRRSLAEPDAIYDFFSEERFPSVGFNVEETEGAHQTSSLVPDDGEDIRAEYAAFMERLWARRQADGGRLRVREFERELAMIRELQRDAEFVPVPDEAVPFANITIRRDGAVSTFSPELASSSSTRYGDFVIGNVLTHTPEQVRAGAALMTIASDVEAGRAHCRRECPYFPVCGGGFQSNRVAEHGSLAASETHTCRVHRKVLADVVLTKLRDITTMYDEAEGQRASLTA